MLWGLQPEQRWVVAILTGKKETCGHVGACSRR